MKTTVICLVSHARKVSFGSSLLQDISTVGTGPTAIYKKFRYVIYIFLTFYNMLAPSFKGCHFVIFFISIEISVVSTKPFIQR